MMRNKLSDFLDARADEYRKMYSRRPTSLLNIQNKSSQFEKKAIRNLQEKKQLRLLPSFVDIHEQNLSGRSSSQDFKAILSTAIALTVESTTDTKPLVFKMEIPQCITVKSSK